MKKIAIYGSGGFGREVQMLINDINKIEPTYKIIGYIDDNKKVGDLVNGIPVLGGKDYLNSVSEPICLTIAIGSPDTKKLIVQSISNKYISFPTLIHPTCIIGNDSITKIGEGCIICAGNIITTNIIIGDFVILNLMCTVGHDTTIRSYCSFMPSVNISGEVEIGEQVYVGTGAKIINQLKINNNTIIGSGAVVTTSLPSNCTAVGIPARVIKQR